MSTVGTWFEQRSFHHGQFADTEALADLKRERDLSVTLVLPTRNVAETIGPILTIIGELNRAPLVDEVLVVDADSVDGTARIAADLGASVYSENSLMPEFGKNQGKGDAMWRSLSVARGDIVMFADSDTKEFAPELIVGVLGVMLTEPDIGFVKGGYRRPFVESGHSRKPDGGGRVTELLAKPLLNLLFPRLAGFVQPLAGEFAARRDLFSSIPFFTGYGVEAGILIDALDELGLDGMAQVDLGERINRHQDLADLGRMSHSVLRAVLQRTTSIAGPHPTDWTFAGSKLRYFHAVSSPHGFELEEFAEELLERPPMNVALSRRRNAA